MEKFSFGLFNRKGKRVGTTTFFGKSSRAARSAGSRFLHRMGVQDIKRRRRPAARKRRK